MNRSEVLEHWRACYSRAKFPATRKALHRLAILLQNAPNPKQKEAHAPHRPPAIPRA